MAAHYVHMKEAFRFLTQWIIRGDEALLRPIISFSFRLPSLPPPPPPPFFFFFHPTRGV